MEAACSGVLPAPNTTSEILPQRAVRVDLHEAKIVDRLCAEGVEQGGFPPCRT